MAQGIILKTGGGTKVTKTLLWTNPNPTSAFTQQTITLSEAMTDFQYIKFVYKNYATDTKTYEIWTTYSNLCQRGQINRPFVLNSSISTSSNWVVSRGLWATSTKTIYADNTYVWANGSTATSTCIPCQIYGINGLDLED